ncbi:Hydroxyacylglutathione hydrolase C-terminus [Limnospira platensis C1]|nr:Hydroxyacylglutathione hydrolase C-terminus [Arthrospira platensis C1]
MRSLPDDTRIWCAHEYTLNNLKFALTVDGDNINLRDRLEKVTIARSQNQPTIPSLIGVEKATNPFLRWDEPALQLAVQGKDDIQTFARIRGMKDQF